MHNFFGDIFETIAADNPDLWIWLGDVSYIDSPDMSFKSMDE